VTLPRTYLFVPGDRPERIAKALVTEADAVVIDLEDAVASAAKPLARDSVSQVLAGLDVQEMARVVVRINDDATPWHEDDVALLAAHRVLCVMLPKAERVESIARLRLACPDIAVLALVESARGVLAAEAIAMTAGVQRLVFGTIDFALDLDLSGDPAGLEYAAARLALASRAAGIAAPVAGVTTAIDDEAVLRAEVARARAHGFGAKLCIHPRQLAIVHAALAPTADELSWARRVIEAATGSAGAVQLDGRMIDKPVIERARRTLARAR
jgi:citrate lyase subunit beta/citryl-CoA lyase